jgi:hypothetical protein
MPVAMACAQNWSVCSNSWKISMTFWTLTGLPSAGFGV